MFDEDGRYFIRSVMMFWPGFKDLALVNVSINNFRVSVISLPVRPPNRNSLYKYINQPSNKAKLNIEPHYFKFILNDTKLNLIDKILSEIIF